MLPNEKTNKVTLSLPETTLKKESKKGLFHFFRGEKNKLSQIESISYQNESGQELSFFKVTDLSDSTKYYEIKPSAVDSLSQSIQMALPAGQHLYTVTELVKQAPYGLFTSTVDPNQLSHFTKDGTFTTIVHGHNGIVRHAGFKQIPGFGVFNLAAFATVAFQAMAMMSGHHYLPIINQTLTSIENSIQDIKTYLTEKDKGILEYAQKLVFDSLFYPTNADKDLDVILEYKNKVAEIYYQYMDSIKGQIKLIMNYSAISESVDLRMNKFFKTVHKLTESMKIYEASYHVFFQITLAEIFIHMKKGTDTNVLSSLFKRAEILCQDPFENPYKDFNWVLDIAKDIWEKKKTWFEDTSETLFGYDNYKKERLFAPIIACVNDLNDSVNMAETKQLIETFRALQGSRKILVIPEEKGTDPKVFISMNADDSTLQSGTFKEKNDGTV